MSIGLKEKLAAKNFYSTLISTNCLTELHSHHPGECSAYCFLPTRNSINYSVGRSVGQSVSWTISWSVGNLVGQLVGWLVGRLVGRLVVNSFLSL